MKIKIIFFLSILLTSCSNVPTGNSEKPNSRLKNYLPNLSFGISPGQADGVYSLVSKKDGKWKIDKMTNKSINRENSNQEIIFINKGFNYASPAFFYDGQDVGHGFKTYSKDDSGEYKIGCVSGAISVLQVLPTSSYGPCNKTATLKKVEGKAAGEFLFLALTFGTASIYTKVTDNNSIRKIILDTNLVEKSKEYCKKNMPRCEEISIPKISSAYANMNINYSPEVAASEKRKRNSEKVNPNFTACLLRYGFVENSNPNDFNQMTDNARAGQICRRQRERVRGY